MFLVYRVEGEQREREAPVGGTDNFGGVMQLVEQDAYLHDGAEYSVRQAFEGQTQTVHRGTIVRHKDLSFTVMPDRSRVDWGELFGKV